MPENILINGSIGCTLLTNKNIKIIVFADSHDGTKNCGKNQIYISELFNNIINKDNYKLLLEEPPRDKTSEIKELWGNSIHTQKLKNLYLKNSDKIEGVDIRFQIIPFSWETDSPLKKTTTFKQYIKKFLDFLSGEHNYFKINLNNIYNIETLNNIKLKEIHIKLLLKLKSLVDKNKKLLNKTIETVEYNNVDILEKLNDINDKIMEYYIILSIIKNIINKKNKIIIHAGLAHTDVVVDWLQNYLDFNIISTKGVNTMENILNSEIQPDSCLEIN